MRQAFAQGKYQEAGETAHSLKGMCLMLGMTKLADACMDLEAVGLGGDTVVWPSLLESLESAREPTLQALWRHLEKPVAG